MSNNEETTTSAEVGSGETADVAPRRRFLGWLMGSGMIAGLVASYGAFAAYLARFLFPARPTDQGWMFVTDLAGMGDGDSLIYKTPGGAPVSITRRGSDAAATAFVALSSTCPHLGCQVHWESQNDRFFCPCHNGVFDPSGKATEGPPADAGQSLLQFPLRVADGMLFIQVPLDQVANARGLSGEGGVLAQQAGSPGPGHDPCLYPETGGRGVKRT